MTWLADAGQAFSPAWSPDGTIIAFAGLRGGDSGIYVMTADGTAVTRLTEEPALREGPSLRVDMEPSWSPDGTKIAFASIREDGHAIYVMNANGSAETRLSDAPGPQNAAWSPDGTRIAFGGNTGSGSGIWVMDVDGTDMTRLTDPGLGGSSPAWSPDGTRIAFARLGEDPGIYVMNADGSAPARLTSDMAALSDGVQIPAGGPADDSFAPDDVGFFLPERVGERDLLRVRDVRVGDPDAIASIQAKSEEEGRILTDVLRGLLKEPSDLGYAVAESAPDGTAGRMTFWAIRVAGIPAQDLLRAYATAAGWESSEPSDMNWRAVDGRRVSGWIPVEGATRPTVWSFLYPKGEVLFIGDGIFPAEDKMAPKLMAAGEEPIVTIEEALGALPPSAAFPVDDTPLESPGA